MYLSYAAEHIQGIDIRSNTQVKSYYVHKELKTVVYSLGENVLQPPYNNMAIFLNYTVKHQNAIHSSLGQNRLQFMLHGVSQSPAFN